MLLAVVSNSEHARNTAVLLTPILRTVLIVALVLGAFVIAAALQVGPVAAVASSGAVIGGGALITHLINRVRRR